MSGNFPQWTQGVSGDGAVILCDGLAVPIDEILAILNDHERGQSIVESTIIEVAAGLAETAHIVPPDGGSPTEGERMVADEAARRIRAMNLDAISTNHRAFVDYLAERDAALAREAKLIVALEQIARGSRSQHRRWARIAIDANEQARALAVPSADQEKQK